MSWTDDKEARSQRIRAEIAEETIAALRQRVEELQRERDGWIEEAKRYAGNADYWRELAERLRSLLEGGSDE